LALPFITEWHVPNTWQGLKAAGRTFNFPGGKQFTYLHPDYFVPSEEIAKAAGFDPTQDNFMIRTVVWRAAHDAGRSGLSVKQIRAIIDTLAPRGKVHISAEGSLPPDLEPLRYRGTPGQFHHLLARCRLYCGESITIASEAVMLGVPVLLQIDKEYCYVTEQQEAGLIRRLQPGDDIAQALAAVLTQDPAAYRSRSREFIASKGDLNRYITDQIVRVGKHEMHRKMPTS
jgi:predicted glycosyltransferase